MNSVLLDLGYIQIYWYSICIVVGMAVGMFLVYREAKKRDISESVMTDLIFYTIIVAIIGARLYYVIFDWKKYSNNFLEIFEIWHGGLAIHGAIIAGGLFLILHCKKRKLDTLKILDICAVGLIIGQAIGRWGNFFNQEVYGTEVSIDFLKHLFLPGFIIDGMKIGGVYHHPLFLYESLWCLIGFGVLLFVRRRRYIKTGQIFGLYCMWYSLGRFFLEGMRVEEYNLKIGSFKVAQIVSIGMFLVGLFYFLRRIKTSRFEYLYNDDALKDKKEDERIPIQPFSGYSYDKTTVDITPRRDPNAVEPETQPPLNDELPVVTTSTLNNTSAPSTPATVPQEIQPQAIPVVQQQPVVEQNIQPVQQQVMVQQSVPQQMPTMQQQMVMPQQQVMQQQFVPQDIQQPHGNMFIPQDIQDAPMEQPAPQSVEEQTRSAFMDISEINKLSGGNNSNLN